MNILNTMQLVQKAEKVIESIANAKPAEAIENVQRVFATDGTEYMLKIVATRSDSSEDVDVLIANAVAVKKIQQEVIYN